MAVILIRPTQEYPNEINDAGNYFDIIEDRNKCPDNELIIGRYSVLPYYMELEDELNKKQSKLINSYSQYNWISSFKYYEHVKQFTFETWAENDFYNNAPEGKYIVKGTTNSRKQQWNKLMLAQSKDHAIKIYEKLKNDNLLSCQDIIFRKFEQLDILGHGDNELPYANEWRVFCYKDNILCYGFYWTQCCNVDNVSIDNDFLLFVNQLMAIVSKHVNFYVLDIAKTINGQWKLVEINDGQMSGLCSVDAHQLYDNLNKVIG